MSPPYTNRSPIPDHEYQILAIIPARGGSKGIPRKNLRVVGGKPLIQRTIEAAQRSLRVHRIVVSTDDQDIASIARSCGVEVVMRPVELSNDTASSESVLLHVLEHLQQIEHALPQYIVFLQCTSPLTRPEDIDGAVDLLLANEADNVFSASLFHHFLWRRDENEEAMPVNHEKSIRLRRQDRSPEFIETGALYVMNTEGFLKAGHRFFGKTMLYEIPRERSIEIDEPMDLDIVAILLGHGSRGS